MKKLLLIVLWLFTMSSWSETPPDALLDGLHQDAHEGNFQSYFERYTPDAVFLGTDKSERWSMDEFKAYACLLYTSPSPRDGLLSRMPSSA